MLMSKYTDHPKSMNLHELNDMCFEPPLSLNSGEKIPCKVKITSSLPIPGNKYKKKREENNNTDYNNMDPPICIPICLSTYINIYTSICVKKNIITRV